MTSAHTVPPPSSAFDLARFDSLRPYEPDSEIWRRNLSALRAATPDVAAWIASAEIPEHWRPALALDDWPTWRVERGEAPEWLGASAAPESRAGAVLSEFQRVEQNVALLSLAAGAELSLLLRRAPVFVAVFALESDPRVVAAVLRLHDFSADIADGRCVFVPPNAYDETNTVAVSQAADRRLERVGRSSRAGWLLAHCERAVGLLPPGKIICAPTDSAAEIKAARDLCEFVAGEISARRTAELSRLAARVPCGVAGPNATAAHRLAILALGGTPISIDLADRLTAAARALGWRAAKSVVDGPQNAHILPHCRYLADFEPTLMIAVGHQPDRLPLQLRGEQFEWRLSQAGGLPRGHATILAASPRVANACRAAAAEPVLDFFWACDARDLDAPPLPGDAGSVLLVGDFPDDAPAAAGVQQPTHKLIWKKAQEIAAAGAFTAAIGDAAGLLTAAERATGIPIGDAEIRAAVIRVIEERLIPAAVWRAILAALPRDESKIRAVGTGWETAGIERINLTQRNAPALFAPAVAIAAGYPDPLSPALLRVAARGVPLGLHWTVRHRQGLLGGVLQPGEHFSILSGEREVAAFAAIARGDEAKRRLRAECLRVHLRAHTYERRLMGIVGDGG